MKTIHDVETFVNEYLERHQMKYKKFSRRSDMIQVETFCFNHLEATVKNNRITFKLNGKRTSIYK